MTSLRIQRWGTPEHHVISPVIERTTELQVLLLESPTSRSERIRGWLEDALPRARVTVAGTLDDALEQLETSDYDLVLADLTVPHSEVEAITRGVRRAFPQATLMAVTDHPEPTAAPSTSTEGARGACVAGDEDRDRLARTLLHSVQLGRTERMTHSHLARALTLESRATERLRELDAAKSDLLATTSHELRTPLTVITASAELLQEDLGLTPFQSGLVDAILRNSLRLATLTDELLELARIDSAPTQQEMREVDLSAVVRSASHTLGTLWTSKRLDVRLELPEEPSLVTGDARQLEQLVLNLMRNAIQFTDDHGTITCRVSTTATDVLLEVIDTGIGIPAAQQAQLFTKFFRGSHGGERAVQGTGLGLHFAASIVGNHEGHVRVDSQVGSGSVFTVRLPRLQDSLEGTVSMPSQSRITMRARLVALLDLPGTDPEVRDIAGMLQAALESARETNQWELLADALHFAHRRLGVRGLSQAHVGLICSVVEEAADPKLRAADRDRLHHLLARRATEPLAASSVVAPLVPSAATYLQLLLIGDRTGAVEHAHRCVESGMDAVEVCLDVLEPVQHEVGRRWARGHISIAQEHFCTSATQFVMTHLRPQTSATDLRSRRLLAVHAPGSLHRVGLRMVVDVLGGRGWDATYIEDDVTVDSLIELLTLQRPHILLISASMPSQIPMVHQLIESVRGRIQNWGLKIVVGGRPFVVAPGLAAAVGADGWAPDARTALDVCDELTAVADVPA